MDKQQIETAFQNVSQELEQERLRRVNAENNALKTSMYSDESTQSTFTLQLDIEKELNRFYHMLRGDETYIDEFGNQRWRDAKDDRNRIFTDYGVNIILMQISLYISKINLLANYLPEEVYSKVYQFSKLINDLIYWDYENIFFYPSQEELFEKLKGYTNIDAEVLYDLCEGWSEDELKRKLVYYPIIVNKIKDLVHASYSRAIGGKERSSFRERFNFNVSENFNTPIVAGGIKR